MLAVNKQGEVFIVSFKKDFVGESVKTLKKSKLHANRKGWPNEILWAGGRHCDDPTCLTAEYVVCNDKLDQLIGLVSKSDLGNMVLLPTRQSEREYHAIQKA